MEKNKITYIIVGIIIFIIMFFVIIHLFKRRKNKNYKKILDKLEIEKNKAASIPVSLELSKVEPIIKNEELEEKYAKWTSRLEEIKNEMLPKIDDMLIELDTFFDKKDYNTCDLKIAKTELEIYKVRETSESLIDEIKEITSSDEKYRSIVTKLKTKYRKANNDYQKHKNLYDETQDAISLQLENIEKRFLDFEKAMENNEYSEVVHIVKALTTMIEHISVVVNEIPDLVLMSKQVIPQRIKEIDDTTKQMEKEGYPLSYLNIDYNIKEANKNIGKILDRIRVLNLEDCMFELKTILDYLDSLFVDFEKERLSRKVYEEMNNDFRKKLKQTNKVVQDILEQLDQIKSLYALKQDDVKQIKEEEKKLVIINDEYRKLTSKVENKSTPYSEVHKEVESLTIRLKNLTENIDTSLKNLGTMYDDEQRAREQLEEIEKFLKISKNTIRNYKLPVISNKYFVELNEANEAIGEVIKELSQKPIVIKTLNTRVDTARDLVLKLYNTTNDMIKIAALTEKCIVYLNRFRNHYDEINEDATEAEKEFYKGNYKDALLKSLNAIKIVDTNTYSKLIKVYENNNI